MSKICFITSIYGNYEASCKKFVKQTIETDFICFTDNIDIISNINVLFDTDNDEVKYNYLLNMGEGNFIYTDLIILNLGSLNNRDYNSY